jgi:hypothetical protein
MRRIEKILVPYYGLSDFLVGEIRHFAVEPNKGFYVYHEINDGIAQKRVDLFVYSTGSLIPDAWWWVASTTSEAGYTWHLYWRPSE